MISPKILKEIPKNTIILRMEFIPSRWKRAQVIMLLKPGIPPKHVTSH
jgi:hypothetical protein